jgi:drug/metabolite transporter (DMT)-like permease
VGFSAYVWLLKHAGPSLASTYAFVNPVVAVFLGAAILSEPVTPVTLVAGGIILVAVATIVSGKALRFPWRRAAAPEADAMAA